METSTVKKNTAICTNCKGKGSTFGIRMKVRIKGASILILALAYMVFDWHEFLNMPRIVGWLDLAALIYGGLLFTYAGSAKCPVCEGTGFIDLDNVKTKN